MKASSKDIIINYLEYNSIDDLTENDRILLKKAIGATGNAYAPYSNFKVGAALELFNGEQIIGSNQENIAYPSGLCAERVALFTASAYYPRVAVKTIAVAGKDSDGNIVQASPCGACRQVLAEYENFAKTPIRILFLGENGKVLLFDNVDSILPMQFVTNLNK